MLVLIHDGLEPDARLRAVVDHVFTTRATHAVPTELADPPAGWRGTYDRLAADLDIPESTIDAAMVTLRGLLVGDERIQGVRNMARKKASAGATPQAKLSSAIKTARDIMRKDAGLNGELDRIPQLAWLLFLKAFDGLEQKREVTERRLPAGDRGALPVARLGG